MTRSVGKEIISLGRPGFLNIVFIQGFHEAHWRRVQNMNSSVCSPGIHVIDELVHVLEVLVGIHVHEIISHGEHDVSRVAKIRSFIMHSFDKSFDLNYETRVNYCKCTWYSFCTQFTLSSTL